MSRVNEDGLENLPLECLAACHECDLLMRRETVLPGQTASCPRCGHEIEAHRSQMVSRCLALAISALLLYVPANFLPIMEISILGQVSRDTVWSSIQGLYQTGSSGIAVVVFLCAMACPLLKLLCQLLVLLSIRYRRGQWQGMALYRGYRHLREWGMLEVYLMGVLVSIVKLMSLADLKLGVGMICFVLLLITQICLEVTMSSHQVWDELSGKGRHAGY